MHTVERSRTTKHSVETVWEVLAAFNEVEVWHPRVARSPGTSRADFGVGASRVCYFKDGTQVNETVTSFEAGKSMDIELTEMSMPLKKASGRLTVTPGLGGCTVSLAMHFEPKYGPLGTIMAVFMMKPMMAKMIDEILAGLDEHLAHSRAPARAA